MDTPLKYPSLSRLRVPTKGGRVYSWLEVTAYSLAVIIALFTVRSIARCSPTGVFGTKAAQTTEAQRTHLVVLSPLSLMLMVLWYDLQFPCHALCYPPLAEWHNAEDLHVVHLHVVIALLTHTLCCSGVALSY